MALALLARDWAVARGGTVQGFIVDHGLRPGSAAEAGMVHTRLEQHRLPAEIITLAGIGPGANAARRARHAALEEACARHGIVHLLFGHHAADQAETLQIRALAGSGAAGFAGIAALQESTSVRRLRPLLDRQPARLKDLLRQRRVEWVEDPSNSDPRAQRGRLRLLSGGQGTPELCRAAAVAAERRAADERRAATCLGQNATIFPEGFALLAAGAVPAAAVAALIQALSGSPYPIAPASVSAALTRMHAGNNGATLGGVVVRPAGRDRKLFLLAREPAACGPPVIAARGAVWDRRFRCNRDPGPALAAAQIGPLGTDAAGLRRLSHLPSIVMQGLPAIRLNGKLVAVPHLGYPENSTADALWIQFSPARPAACAPWFGSSAGHAIQEGI
jgi:tRNA(Ile)-lysidine synthase